MNSSGSNPWQRCQKIAEHLTHIHQQHTKQRLVPTTDETKWNGWGYVDTKLFLNSKLQVELSGTRYPDIFGFDRTSSVRVFPLLKSWAEKQIGLNLNKTSFPRTEYPELAAAIVHPEFYEHLQELSIKTSVDTLDRITHSHGHTCQEIYQLRHSPHLRRVPDLIVYPESHQHVVRIVQLAKEYDICIIPYGGGTSVSNALQCEDAEKRTIVSLDMKQMNRIKFIDKENMIACAEAGIVGQDLNRLLESHGVTMGHEPDSGEFSTLGGWVATRASGMKKNRYGNIEDLVLNIKFVTAEGTAEKSCSVPRASMGPDFSQIILGSEGILGVVTEVVFRIRPRPLAQLYDSLLFPNYERGIATLYAIAQADCAPASIRLMDNLQFQLGQALKPQSASPVWSAIVDAAKKTYVTKYKGFRPESMCAATLLLEGEPEEIQQQLKQIVSIAKQYDAIQGGPDNGLRGYFLTYIIAYIRDFAFDYCFLSESFETCVPWSHVYAFCNEIRTSMAATAQRHKIVIPPFICTRVTQVYPTGACVYVYFGLNYGDGVQDPISIFEELEVAAVKVMQKCGASLSHHHGIGKHRRQWLESAISRPAVSAIAAVKNRIDPTNIFGANNLLEPSHTTLKQ